MIGQSIKKYFMLTLKILGAVVVLLFFISFFGDFVSSPKVDINQEDSASLQEKIKVGVTTDKEVYQLFGRPNVYRKKEVNVGGEQNMYTKYVSATWTKAKTKVLIYNLETTELTVFFDDNAKVVSFKIGTEH